MTLPVYCSYQLSSVTEMHASPAMTNIVQDLDVVHASLQARFIHIPVKIFAYSLSIII